MKIFASKSNIGRHYSYERRRQRTYWIFLIPFLTGFVLLFAGIYASSLFYSFNDVVLEGSKGYSQNFSGLANYAQIFKDPQFIVEIRESVLGMLGNIPLVLIYSLFIAVLLSHKMKGRTVFRAIFFIPVILATGFMTKANITNVVGDQMWQGIGAEAATAGTLANGLFDAVDLQKYLSNLSFSPALSGYVIAAVQGIFNIVNISGVQMLIFLAGLQSISPSVYESANIDGATAWEAFWLVTFPMISPLILVNVIYTVIDSFTASTNKIMIRIQQTGFKGSNGIGTASAMAWFYFLIVTVVLVLIVLAFRSYIYYQQRD